MRHSISDFPFSPYSLGTSVSLLGKTIRVDHTVSTADHALSAYCGLEPKISFLYGNNLLWEEELFHRLGRRFSWGGGCIWSQLHPAENSLFNLMLFQKHKKRTM